MNKQILIFDFDNTLVNSLEFWLDVVDNQTFKKYGLKPNPEIKKVHGGKTNKEIANSFIEISGLDISIDDVFNVWYELMFENYTKHIKFIKGAREFLNEMKNQQKTLVLASATGESLLKRVVDALNLDVFDFVCTENTIGHPKRDPEFFVELLKQLDAKPEDVLLFEDSIHSTRSATSIKIECVTLINSLNKVHLEEFQNLSTLIVKDYTDKKLKQL